MTGRTDSQHSERFENRESLGNGEGSKKTQPIAGRLFAEFGDSIFKDSFGIEVFASSDGKEVLVKVVMPVDYRSNITMSFQAKVIRQGLVQLTATIGGASDAICYMRTSQELAKSSGGNLCLRINSVDIWESRDELHHVISVKFPISELVTRLAA